MDRFSPTLGKDEARRYVYRQVEKFDAYVTTNIGAYRGKHLEKLTEWCDKDLQKAVPRKVVTTKIDNIPDDNPVKVIETNKQKLNEYINQSPEIRRKIVINQLSVVIQSSGKRTEISFTENGFWEQFINALRKHGYVT